jgi:hypothetical protein
VTAHARTDSADRSACTIDDVWTASWELDPPGGSASADQGRRERVRQPWLRRPGPATIPLMAQRGCVFLAIVFLGEFGAPGRAVAEEPAPPSASFAVEPSPAVGGAETPAPPPAPPAISPPELAPERAPESRPLAAPVNGDGLLPPVATRQQAFDRNVDHDAVFRAFSRYADTERRLRIGAAVGGVIAGAATVAMGAVFADYFELPPEPFYILGGIAMVAPLAGLLTASSAETHARQLRADEPGHSEAEALGLRQTWATLADSARSRRHWTAAGSFVSSAIAVGFGVAILEGAFTMSSDDRLLWGSMLIGTGAAVAASGATALVVLSPVEAAYQQFDAAAPLRTGPRVSVRGGPGGVKASLSLTF